MKIRNLLISGMSVALMWMVFNMSFQLCDIRDGAIVVTIDGEGFHVTSDLDYDDMTFGGIGEDGIEVYLDACDVAGGTHAPVKSKGVFDIDDSDFWSGE